MRRIICIPFAFEEGANSGVNLKTKDRIAIYLKNAAVALVSAKWNNPDSDVAFATNIKPERLPNDFSKLLLKEHISIMEVPYSAYRFGAHYKWSLAFYKLCVLRALIDQGFDYCCYLDTDVYIQGTFDSVWKESDKHILLYDVNHGFKVSEYCSISGEIDSFFGQQVYATHYGGEFFAASYNNAVLFEQELQLIYHEMIEREFVTQKGDEFLISVAAERKKHMIKNASPYINRYWTGASFRLVSTTYKYNSVDVLHMPAEKEKGMIKLFDRYISQGKKPKNETVWRTCRLNYISPIELIGVKVRDLLKK